MLCSYINLTHQFQILRISNIPHFFFEKVVMPQSTVFFETHQGAQVEVHTGHMASSVLSDIIPCEQLEKRMANRR